MTPEQDESAVPERVWLCKGSNGRLSKKWYTPNVNVADDDRYIAYLRKQSVLDRLKKKRDEWQALINAASASAPVVVLQGQVDAANELIAELEKGVNHDSERRS